MTFSTRRDLREKLYKGWTNRGDNDDEFDNEGNIRRILQLRLERAHLLGYEDFSAFRTANTMAGTGTGGEGPPRRGLGRSAVAKAGAEEARIQRRS